MRDVEVVLVKMSLLLSGSRADCEERLNTEPQSIDFVLLQSTSSTSPNAESASFVLLADEEEVDANCEMLGVGSVEGKGVARPEEGSFSG